MLGLRRRDRGQGVGPGVGIKFGGGGICVATCGGDVAVHGGECPTTIRSGEPSHIAGAVVAETGSGLAMATLATGA